MKGVIDERAEHSVLAALLVRPACWADVEPLLQPDDFGNPRHRAIAHAIWTLRRRGDEADFITIAAELERAGAANLAGQTLASLDAEHIATTPVRHAKRVREVAAARRMAEYLADRGDAQGVLEDPLGFIEETARRVTALADVRRESEFVHLGDLAREHLAEIVARSKGVRRGIGTGIPKLDALTGGVQPGQFTVIAGRPSSGKTALAMQLATTAGKLGPVAFASSETKRLLCMDRWASEMGRVHLQRIRHGTLSRDEMQALIAAYERMRSAGVFIADRRGWRVNELVAQVRAWKREHCRPTACRVCEGTGTFAAEACNVCLGSGKVTPRPALFVDYLQIVRPSSRHSSREQEVAEVSGTLQALAGEEDVAVVALSQLGREAEKRDPDVPPQLSDLRESGAIEQDADNVWFVHRPDRIDESIEKGATVLAVAKQKHGECASVPLWFRGEYQRFEPREGDYTRTSKPKPPKTTRPGDHMPRGDA
jgi:replicative DNA helicase